MVLKQPCIPRRLLMAAGDMGRAHLHPGLVLLQLGPDPLLPDLVFCFTGTSKASVVTPGSPVPAPGAPPDAHPLSPSVQPVLVPGTHLSLLHAAAHSPTRLTSCASWALPLPATQEGFSLLKPVQLSSLHAVRSSP